MRGSAMPPAYIGLPEQARLRVGDTLTFAFLPYPGERESGNVATYEVETATAGEEFAYVDEVRTAIPNSSLARHVTGMELSDRYDLWFLLDGKIKNPAGQHRPAGGQAVPGGDRAGKADRTVRTGIAGRFRSRRRHLPGGSGYNPAGLGGQPVTAGGSKL